MNWEQVTTLVDYDNNLFIAMKLDGSVILSTMRRDNTNNSITLYYDKEFSSLDDCFAYVESGLGT